MNPKVLKSIAIAVFTATALNAQSVGVSATGTTPDQSAMLDVSSTEKGFLAPRMSEAQRGAIASPAEGLIVFQTDGADAGLWIYNGSWVRLSDTLQKGEQGIQGPAGEDGATGPAGEDGATGPAGEDGATGPAGEDGSSIIWKGTATTAPLSPIKNWAYYNSDDGKSYIHTGEEWVVMTQDGTGDLYALKTNLADSTSAVRTDLATKVALTDSTAQVRSEIPSITALATKQSVIDSTSAVRTALDLKAPLASPIFTGVAIASQNLAVKNGNTSAGGIEIYEDSDDGTEKLTITAPALGADYTLTLPADDGDASQVLTTDGSGALSWTTAAAPNWANPGTIGSGSASSGAFTTLTASSTLGVTGNATVGGTLTTTGTLTSGTDGTDGSLAIYSEQGGTDYTYTIQPNVTATQDVTLTLPADDGDASQVLTTDGSGALSWATAGGLTNFTETAYIYSSRAGAKLVADNGSETVVDIVLSPKGNGGILAQQSDGTTAGGNNRGGNVVDLQQSRTAATQVAAGYASVISGGIDNSSTGPYAVVAGGQRNTAGQNAAVLGGDNNQATGNTSTIGAGYGNKASGYYSVTGGGHYNDAQGYCATVSGGQSNKARGSHSVALGFGNNASSMGETVLGLNATEVVGDSATNTATDRLLVVGNGNAWNDRSDALTLLKNGNMTVAGTLTSGAVTYPNTIGTDGYILTTHTNGTATWEAAAAGGATQLTGLSDVGTATATSGHLLVADGSDWDNVAMSGDATLANTGALTIAPSAVELTMMADITRGSMIIGNATADPTLLDASGNGKIIVGDGNDISSVSISGDATLANTGALTIATDAVDGTDISLASEATGDVMYFNGTDWIRLGKGADGEVLTLASGVPTWAAGATEPDFGMYSVGASGTYTKLQINAASPSSSYQRGISTSGTAITLNAGKLYEFSATLQPYNFSDDNVHEYRFYDVTNSTTLGSGVYWGNPNGAGTRIGNYTTQPILFMIRPTTNIEVELRQTMRIPADATQPAIYGTVTVKEIR